MNINIIRFIPFSMLINGMFLCNTAFVQNSPESLDHIVSFATKLCMDVKQEYNYDREKIELSLTAGANAALLRKVLGFKLDGDGKYIRELTKGEGLPVSDIADALMTSMNCRENLAMMLLSERQKIIEHNLKIEQDLHRIKNEERVKQQQEVENKRKLAVACKAIKKCESNAESYYESCVQKAKRASINNDLKIKNCDIHRRSKVRKCTVDYGKYTC